MRNWLRPTCPSDESAKASELQWYWDSGGVVTATSSYKACVGDGTQSFSSSPIAAGGRIYVLSEDGDTFVFEAGDAYREVARNSLGEMSLASPAADADSLYLRTLTRLYRIKSAAGR